METDLTAAYDRCRELHRHHGRTYYLATRLLPAWKRRHVHALYGFTRYADEIVDRTEDLPPAERAARLRPTGPDRFVAGLHGAPVDDPLLPAVLHTIAVFDLDRADFASFLRSMAMDLTVTAYPTYDDLLDYMEGSAAVIGTMMLPILGQLRPGRGPGAGPAARLRLPAHQLHPGRRRGPRPGPHLPARRGPGRVRRHPRGPARGPRAAAAAPTGSAS